MLILASKSPRRKEILIKRNIPFYIDVSNFDESKITVNNEDLPLILSKEKAKEVFLKHPNDLVLGCDTIVILDKVIYGKPKDKNDAFRILKILSNKTHKVITGYTLMAKDFVIFKKVESLVTFNDLSDDFINRYIETGSPMDKAGAYGLQDEGFNLVRYVKGSVNNVIGLPIEEIEKDLLKIKKQYPNLF